MALVQPLATDSLLSDNHVLMHKVYAIDSAALPESVQVASNGNVTMPYSLIITGTATSSSFIGPLTGNVTGNVAGNASTSTTAPTTALLSTGSVAGAVLQAQYFQNGIQADTCSPSGDFSLIQNSVSPFVSHYTGAANNTMVLASGFVGIGLTNPNCALDVVGGARFANIRYNTGLAVTNSATSATLSAANIAKGVVFQQTSGYATYTLDTGTNLSNALVGAAPGDLLDFVVSNAGSGNITMNGAVGTTLGNAMIVNTLQKQTILCYMHRN